MRPVEYETKDIIQAGLELQALSSKVSGFSLRQKIGGGNAKRLMQVWEEYLRTQDLRNIRFFLSSETQVKSLNRRKCLYI